MKMIKFLSLVIIILFSFITCGSLSDPDKFLTETNSDDSLFDFLCSKIECPLPKKRPFYEYYEDCSIGFMSLYSSQSYLNGYKERRLLPSIINLYSIKPIESPVLLENISLKKDLLAVFIQQHPKKRLSHQYYDVLHWPENVDRFRDFWTFEMISKIREKLHILVFIPNTGSVNLNFNVTLDMSLSRNSSASILLERFIKETGEVSASSINWKCLDRKDIPLKYSNVPILYRIQKCTEIGKSWTIFILRFVVILN